MALIDQMKLLISLAQIDGTVAAREKNFIRNIAHANGLGDSEIDPLFDQRHPVIIPEDLDEDEKFNCIFNLVQLMKIDERMYKEELLFCSKIAANLGYDKQVMFDLVLHVKSSTMDQKEKDDLKELVRKYMN